MKSLCIVLVLLFGVFACDVPFEEEQEMDLKSGQMVERTIKFHRASGTMNVELNAEACPETEHQMIITGGGNATFLGNFTVLNTVCVNLQGEAVSPILGELTAANGDMLYSIVTTPPWEENGMVYYLYNIRSELCTGRFEGATGFIIMYGVIDHVAMTWDLKGIGRITF
jgi:hypothetical protein